MNQSDSPLRLLAKTYANNLITREQYVEIRAQLLRRLQSNGALSDADLQDFSALVGGDQPKVEARRYTSSDWLIIGLGLAASVVLAYVLYG